jgi:membrane protease YdiL (CAAX protease family)
MTTIKAFIKRHPLLTYFALAFAVSWGGILIVVGPGGIPGNSEQLEMLFPFGYLAMLAGPSVAGILLTGLVHGRAGLREFLSRLLRWRVGARWYAVALLSAPLLATAVLFTLSLTSPIFLPGIFASDDKATLLLFGIAGAIMVGIFEELGWTGFAVPALRLRHGVLSTGLIVGVLWERALPCEVVGKRQFLRSALAVPLPAPDPLLLPASLQGAHGVGLRPYWWELARGDAHARESHSQHADPRSSGGIRGAPLDLEPRIGRRAVGLRCSGRRGQRRASLATTAPEAGG